MVSLAAGVGQVWFKALALEARERRFESFTPDMSVLAVFAVIGVILWLVFRKRGTRDRKRYASQDQKRIIFARYHGRCAHCGRKCTRTRQPVPNQANVDHIVPYSWGGKTELSNMQLLCRQCNLSKGARFKG